MAAVSENVIIKDPNILAETCLPRNPRSFQSLDRLSGRGDKLDQFLEEYLASAANLPLPQSRKQG